MDTDIRDALDRAIGDGPEPPSPDLLLARGHRALRRRRLAEAGSAAAAVVAVVALGAAMAGGPAQRTAPGPASPGPASPGPATAGASPTAAPRTDDGAFPAPDAPVVRDATLSAGWPVTQEPDGLHVSPRVTVLRVWDDPWQLRGRGAWSVAVAYRFRGVTMWYAGSVDAGYGGSNALIPASQSGGLDFRGWVEDEGSVLADDTGARPRSGPPTPDGGWPGLTELRLVRLVEGSERLQPLDGVTLLAQRPHPRLPDSWAAAGDRSAAAAVRFDGRRYYVLARDLGDGPPQYVAVAASDGGATLDDFLDLARERYAEGGGGLL